jgi:hypothetical protein
VSPEREGVGDKCVPSVYMRPGDVVEVDLGPVGTLVNPVIVEAHLFVFLAVEKDDDYTTKVDYTRAILDEVS